MREGRSLVVFGLCAACAQSVAQGVMDAGSADVSPPQVNDTPTSDRAEVVCPSPPGGPLRDPPEGAAAVVDVDEDVVFGCVLRGAGRIRCIGRGGGGVGTFADGTSQDTPGLQPFVLPGVEDVRAFDMSPGVSCAVRGDGTVWCWGDNSDGRVHPDLPRRVLTPTPVPGVARARRVTTALSWVSPCVVFDDGRVQCWNDARDAQRVPSDWTGVVDVVRTSGSRHLCARFTDGRAICRASDGGEVTFAAGVVRQFAAGLGSVCRLDRDGVVACWGYDHSAGTPVPQAVDVGVRCATTIAAGADRFCASLTDGTVTCWGEDAFRSAGPHTAARRVAGIDRAVRVFRGVNTPCALRDDGSLWCWDGPFVHYLGVAPPVRVDW